MKLMTDYWEGPQNKGTTDDDPSWMSFLHAIQSLDQDKRTQVVLQNDDYSNISIGGGNGKYNVCIATSDERYFCLVRKGKEEEEEEIVVGGQRSDFPKYMIVDLKMAIQAAGKFYKDKEMDESLDWIET